jgi:ferritin-like metal-binding protein YciE
MKDFHQLFVDGLKDIYSAESQSLKWMPEVILAAKSSKLKEALKEHLEDTRKQIKRLEHIASDLKQNFSGSVCEAMHGLWKEWSHVTKSHYSDDVQDAAIIAFMQKVKHYEISVYGSLKTYAKHLHHLKIEEWLKESIKEEGHADKKLTEIAEGTSFAGGINTKACKKRCA